MLDAKPKFFDYVDYVKDKFGEGPLFPQFNLDGYGRRNGPAGSLISNWFRSVVLPIGKIAEKKSFESHRHTAISCVRNMLTPDGHLAVKADVERYLFGHAPADVHARYGEQWTKTLKTAIENIPNPFL